MNLFARCPFVMDGFPTHTILQTMKFPKSTMTKFFSSFAIGFWLSLVFTSSLSAAQYEACGELDRHGAYGPYDYTDPFHFREKLPIVERYHFTRGVENLTKGNTGRVIDDLNYVLMAFPNHHRALASMAKLAIREGKPKPTLSNFTLECWFDRAMRWRAKDGVVRMIFGNYLSQTKNYTQALAQYQAAEELLKNNANLYYNMGLLYMDLKNYDKAQEYAKKAYDQGFPLLGLKNQLQKVGKSP